jgi:hypothetical protein
VPLVRVAPVFFRRDPMMKSKSKPVCGEVMRAALRRVVGTDTPAVAVLACEDPRTEREVERVYEEIMREREDELIFAFFDEREQFDDGGVPDPD